MNSLELFLDHCLILEHFQNSSVNKQKVQIIDCLSEYGRGKNTTTLTCKLDLERPDRILLGAIETAC